VSTDRGLKLSTTVFKHSKLSGKFFCGGTKCEVLVKKCLVPHSVEMLLKDLKEEILISLQFMLLIKEASFMKNLMKQPMPFLIKYTQLYVNTV
jgi:hypothetical protein